MTVRLFLQASLLLSPTTRQLASSFYLPSQSVITRSVSSCAASQVRMSSSETSNGGIIALNVKFLVKPNFKESLLEVLADDAKKSRDTEPGCLQFLIGIDVNDPYTLYLHEQYKSQTDFDFHGTTPHLKAVLDFVNEEDPLVEPMVGQVYKCQHSPVKIDNSKFPAFCLNVESCIKPEIREEFVDLMMSHQQNSKVEPLCRQFDWGVSLEDPNAFYIHEEYEGKEGFDAHESSSHFAKFLQFNKEKQPYSKPQVVQFYETLPL